MHSFSQTAEQCCMRLFRSKRKEFKMECRLFEYGSCVANLLAVCELYGHSRASLAALCGVSTEEVERWYNGSADIPVNLMLKIAKLNGVFV